MNPLRLPTWLRAALATALLGASALPLAGCFNPFNPVVSNDRGVSTPPPAPSTPANAIRLFEWCYNNRAADIYREVFTDNYEFQFATTDSAGNAYRGDPWRREDEMAYATNLFVGGGNRAPATSVTLTFDRTLRAVNDSRPGKNGRWHKEIRTTVALSVRTTDEALDVQGFARFFLVRGDSVLVGGDAAVIPPELVARGFRPDSTRWWIERWEDETVQSGGGLALSRTPTSGVRPAAPGATSGLPLRVSWGEVKARNRH